MREDVTGRRSQKKDREKGRAVNTTGDLESKILLALSL